MSSAISFEKDFKVVSEAMKSKTTIPLSEFLPFIELYRRSEDQRDIMSNQERFDLSVAFSEKVSLYHELNVVDDFTGEELFTLPKILTSVNSIAFDEALSKPMGVLMRPVSAPRHVAEATKKILELLIASQGKDKKEYINRIKNEKDRFSELFVKIKELKNADIQVKTEDDNEFPSELVEESDDSSFGTFSED